MADIWNDNTISTTNLTFLSNSQGVTYEGGSGSDRLILFDKKAPSFAQSHL